MFKENQIGDVGELLNQRGSFHTERIKPAARNLENAVLDQDAVFSAESEDELTQFEEENQSRFPAILQDFFTEYKETESSRLSAHGYAHVIDNLKSAVRIFDEYRNAGNPLREVDKLEVVLACLGHDLGRCTEKSLDISNKESGLITAQMMGKKQWRRNGLPQSLGKRVLYDIGTGFHPETGHRNADIVHQCDREQLLGTEMFPRTLILGIGEGHYDFTWPDAEEIKGESIDLKNPYDQNTPVYSIPQRMEFWARNVYPPISPEGKKAIDRGKMETVALLMISLTGKPNEYWKSVFSAEINTGLSTGRFKKPFSKELFDAGRREYEDFLATINQQEYSKEKLLELMDCVNVVEEVGTLPDFQKNLLQTIDSHTEDENRNLWLMLLYTLKISHQRRVEELQSLQDRHHEGLEKVVSDHIAEDLRGREQRYTDLVEENSPEQNHLE